MASHSNRSISTHASKRPSHGLSLLRAFRSYMLDEVVLGLTVPLGTTSGADRTIDYRVLVVN